MNLLIANRGEIAVRIIASARAEGHRTIAVYSDADADAPHVHAADVATRIGPAAPRESYLDIAAIIDAARRTGAQAVHPGYGFLSENAEFAQACTAAGLVFIGPTPEVIELMGDKAAAKRRMAFAGVPLVAGYQGSEQDDDKLTVEADAIGYPLMVKAAAGGGGKGMRLVEQATDLPHALAAARREALGAFGSDVLILERALVAPRHVEIQVLADQHGKVIALGERDCSIQRRHQKIIEEAPSPALDEALRAEMSKAAVTAAAEIGYVGAGTVEFLLGANGSFAFLEMNTRLQVEHPVTEMTTGLDLVAWQLRIAAGEHLTVDQDDIALTGHAIEARLYAENADYLPSAGRIELWTPPGGTGVRVDAGIATGYVVSPNYDPMLAKIVAHGTTREQARQRLIAALERTVLLGITSNRAFLAEVLRDPRFASGEFSTAFLTDHTPAVEAATSRHLAAAAVALHGERERRGEARSPGLAGWTNAATQHSARRLAASGQVHDMLVERSRDGLDVTIDGSPIDDPAVPTATLVLDDSRVLAAFAALDLDVTDVTLALADATTDGGSGQITSPFHGVVSAVFVEVGARVQAGDRLAVVEAMKMEHPIVADIAGVVTEITRAGGQVAGGDLLARIETEDEDA